MLGENIRKYRKAKKMTQQQLADAIGVLAAAIYKYEKNLVSPTFDRLNKIADVLEVDVTVLIEDGMNLDTDRERKDVNVADLFSGIGLDLKQEKKEYAIDDYYNRLNKRGQRKAIAYVKDLSENPKYRNKK